MEQIDELVVGLLLNEDRHELKKLSSRNAEARNRIEEYEDLLELCEDLKEDGFDARVYPSSPVDKDKSWSKILSQIQFD